MRLTLTRHSLLCDFATGSEWALRVSPIDQTWQWWDLKDAFKERGFQPTYVGEPSNGYAVVKFKEESEAKVRVRA